MAITTLTASTQAAAINYAYTTSGTTDWSGIANNTYFYDLTTKLPYFKDSGGNVQNAFFTGGTISGSLTATTVSATTFYGNGSNLTGISGGGSFSGGTVSNASVFTGGLSATTFTVTNSTVLSGSTTFNDGFNSIVYNSGYTATFPTGSYTVNGRTNLNGIISVTGSTSINGSLSVTGNSSINGVLSASTLTLTSVPVNDDTTTQILSRDATTGAVEYINLSAITSYNYGLSFALANSVYLT